MLKLIFLFLIVKCNGDRAKVYRQIGEQKFIHVVSFHPQYVHRNAITSERSPKTKSRVFRNVQVPLNGRVQRKSITLGSVHNATNISRDLPQLPLFTYDAGNHHLNKLSEDKHTMEDAAEFAKNLERTTVTTRRDMGKIVTTVSPVSSSKTIPSIVTPRVITNDKKQQVKQSSSNFPQQPSTGRKQQDLVKNLIGAQLGNVQVTPPNLSFSLQTSHAQPDLQGLLHGQLAPQIQPGMPTPTGAITISKPPNQTVQLNTMTGFPSGIPILHSQYPPIPQVAAVPVVPPVPPTPTKPFTPPIPNPIFQPHPPIPAQVQPAHVPSTEFSTQGALVASSFPGRVEVMNGQAANSSLEQLGCGFDWLTNTCKDLFTIGWCGQCHDFGNIFMHDCKCVQPLIALPPMQPVQPALLFNMI